MNGFEDERALENLDPGRVDSRYWIRFHGTVMEAAAPILAARRARARMTLGRVFLSWSRLLLPATVTAAAIATLLVLYDPASQGPAGPEDDFVLGVEEVLWVAEDEAAEEPFPTFLFLDDELDRDVILLALEDY